MMDFNLFLLKIRSKQNHCLDYQAPYVSIERVIRDIAFLNWTI